MLHVLEVPYLLTGNHNFTYGYGGTKTLCETHDFDPLAIEYDFQM